MSLSPEDPVFSGRYCVSRRLREQGFEFAFPDVASALKDVRRLELPDAGD